MATIATVTYAKIHFPRLIARAEAGEEIVIARGSKPAVRLVPVEKRRLEKRRWSLGQMR